MPANVDSQDASHEEIKQIHARLKDTFDAGVTRPLAWRRRQLLQLARMLQDNIKLIEDSLLSDLGKPRFETTVIEVSTTIQACVKAAGLLEEWTRPEKPVVEDWQSSWDATIYKEPKGVALLISPWNYPWIITLLPFVGAIAAGCTAVLKPSELSPTCSSVMASLVAKYLDPAAYVVVQGGPDVATALLDLRWDHIFFTGSGRIGRIVAAAAAKHVTPVTLELGGKCPVVIDVDCDLDLAAKRTLYGKIQNAGQVCVTPDYVLVHRAVRPAFEEALRKFYKEFFPNGALAKNFEYSKIVNKPHLDRLKDLIVNTKGKVILGGENMGERIAPTVVSGVKLDDVLMEDEIFGPILSLIEVESIDQAIEIINARPLPLVIYPFTTNESTKHKFLERTRSGSLVMNDTFMQLIVDEIPFGGQGESGYGAYFSKYSFETFTHRRTYLNVPPTMEGQLALRYQPYTQEAYKIMTAGAHIAIPTA